MFDFFVKKEKLVKWNLATSRKYKIGDIIYIWYSYIECETENIILEVNCNYLHVREIRGFNVVTKKEIAYDSNNIGDIKLNTPNAIKYWNKHISFTKRYLS
jgi:hypothetical protein